MSAVFSPNKNLIEPASGSFNNAWAAPVNSNWAIIDQALGGTCIINVTGVAAGFILLEVAQYQCLSFIFEGTLSANLGYVVPAGVGGQWTVLNATNGGFSISFYTNQQTAPGVGFPYGYNTICWSDGINMRFSDDGTANTAQNNAQAYAANAANVAQSNAEAYASSVANTAQSNAEGYAASVANTAESNAIVASESYADSVANTAQSNAEGYASSVANTAQVNAENYAASVASAAQTNAINSAVATSESYANGLTTGGSNSNGTYRKTSDGTLEQWGILPAGVTGNGYTQTFPINFSSVRSIVLSPIGQDSTYYIATIANNAFSVYIGAYNTQFYWVAYGRT